LNIQTKDLEGRTLEMTIEVPTDDIERAMRSAAKRMSKNTSFPGFRPGKAPYDVIVNRFGEDAVFDEALDNLGQEVYRKALEAEEIEPYAIGSLEEIVSREPLVLRFSVPLAPTIDLGDFRSIRVDYDEPEIDDDAVNDYLEMVRERQALIEPVERASQLSDVVVVDIEGNLADPEDEQNSSLVDEKGVPLLVDEETDYPFPGIHEHLVDRSAGDVVEVEHTFPDDYPSENLQAKKASFNLTIQDVKSRLVPEWSDDLARTVGDFDDLLDLRVKTRQMLEDRAQQEAKSAYSQEVIETLVEGSEIDFPSVLLDNEIGDMLRDLEQRLSQEGLTMENYLTIEGKTIEELRDELKPQAERRIHTGLVLGQVVEETSMSIEDEDIDQEINRMSESWADQRDQVHQLLNTASGRQRVGVDLLTEKAIEYVTTIARGEDPDAIVETEVDPEPKEAEDVTQEEIQPQAVDEQE
jgi:trigger factor